MAFSFFQTMDFPEGILDSGDLVRPDIEIKRKRLRSVKRRAVAP